MEETTLAITIWILITLVVGYRLTKIQTNIQKILKEIRTLNREGLRINKKPTKTRKTKKK